MLLYFFLNGLMIRYLTNPISSKALKSKKLLWCPFCAFNGHRRLISNLYNQQYYWNKKGIYICFIIGSPVFIVWRLMCLGLSILWLWMACLYGLCGSWIAFWCRLTLGNLTTCRKFMPELRLAWACLCREYFIVPGWNFFFGRNVFFLSNISLNFPKFILCWNHKFKN